MRPRADDIALLMECARPRTRTRPDRVAEGVATDRDWNSLLEIARQHAMVPLLGDTLRSADVPLPPHARLRLGEAGESAAVAALHLMDVTFRTIESLQGVGIAAVPFKGPTLSSQLYGSPAMRSSNDVDLLIEPRVALAARRELESAGFSFWTHLNVKEEQRFLRYASEYTLTDPRGTIVELNWALAPRSFGVRLETRHLLASTTEHEVGGRTLSVLRPEEYFIALCVHGGKHLWERIGWVADVAQLAESEPMDWPRLISLARRTDVERHVALGLALIRAVSPETAARAGTQAAELSSDPVEALARAVIDRWSTRWPADPDRLVDPLTLRLHARTAARVGQVLRTALTPTVEDWRFVGLPSSLDWLYPAVRPFRLLAKYGRRALARD